MSALFVLRVSWPGETPIKGSDVRRAVLHYIQANDGDAERYGAELAGYEVHVESPDRA